MEGKAIDMYLDEIGREVLLTSEEEKNLSDRIKTGDMAAVNRLVEANLRFVVKIATQYRGQGLSLDDLVSEGNMGLMRAALKFDADRGTRFVNYAVVFIRQQIEKAISEQTSQYKVPRRSDAQCRLGGKAVSVDAPLGGKSNMSLLSVLVNHDSPMADEHIYSETVERAVEFAVRALDEREAHVVNAFFGLTQEHETMAEIAEDMGLRRERVRQIRNRAIRRMKKAYKLRLAELRR